MKVTSYQAPTGDANRMSWKTTGLIILFIVVGFFLLIGIDQVFDPANEKERLALLRVGYEHPEIVGIVGSVQRVSIANRKKEGLAILARARPLDWNRSQQGESATGVARIFVLGDKDADFFVVTYTYLKREQRMVVDRIERAIWGGRASGGSDVSENQPLSHEAQAGENTRR